MAMMPRRVAFACAVFLLAWSASAVMAGDWYDGPFERWYDRNFYWRATRGAIYAMGNRIALSEANPEIDDGYKAPIITRDRNDMLRLRSTLPPAQWRSAYPCCYSRKPIHIR
jgi:hypothetical protein